jgi:hypothetical protein
MSVILWRGMGKSSQPIGQDHGDGWYSSPSLIRWKRLGEVCSSTDSHVDRTFLIEVFFISAYRNFLKRCIMNNVNQNSERLLASRKECYAQKNRSPQ